MFHSHMQRFLIVTVIVLVSSPAFAQSALGTPTGSAVNASVGSYTYGEPGDHSISIHGPKAGGEFTGTFSLDKHAHWFAQANARANIGRASYDGWCSPWL